MTICCSILLRVCCHRRHRLIRSQPRLPTPCLIPMAPWQPLPNNLPHPPPRRLHTTMINDANRTPPTSLKLHSYIQPWSLMVKLPHLQGYIQSWSIDAGSTHPPAGGLHTTIKNDTRSYQCPIPNYHQKGYMPLRTLIHTLPHLSSCLHATKKYDACSLWDRIWSCLKLLFSRMRKVIGQWHLLLLLNISRTLLLYITNRFFHVVNL